MTAHYINLHFTLLRLPLVKCGASHMLSEKPQRTQSGTMLLFVDLD